MRKIAILLFVSFCFSPLFADNIFDAIQRADLKAVKSYIEVLGIPVDVKDNFGNLLFKDALWAYSNYLEGNERDHKIIEQKREIVYYLYTKGASPEGEIPFKESDSYLSTYLIFEKICNAIDDLSVVMYSKNITLADHWLSQEPPYLIVQDSKGQLLKNIPDPRFIIYFAKRLPNLEGQKGLLSLSIWGNSDEKWCEEVEKSSNALAYYAAISDMDNVKKLLRENTDSTIAILVSIVSDNIDMLKFFDDLGQVTPLVAKVALCFPISPSMKMFLKKYATTQYGEILE